MQAASGWFRRLFWVSLRVIIAASATALMPPVALAQSPGPDPYANAPVLASHQTPPDPYGRFERVRIVDAGGPYPLIRVHDRVQVDPVTLSLQDDCGSWEVDGEFVIDEDAEPAAMAGLANLTINCEFAADQAYDGNIVLAIEAAGAKQAGVPAPQDFIADNFVLDTPIVLEVEACQEQAKKVCWAESTVSQSCEVKEA